MTDKYDFKVCVTEANAFLQVAEQLAKSVNTMLGGGMYPFAVNATFACELYLKAILIYNSPNGTVMRSHKLDDLFNELPDDVKIQIESAYKKTCTSSLDTLLAENSTAFIEWRYAFENGVRINVTGTLAFANALKDYVVTLQ